MKKTLHRFLLTGFLAAGLISYGSQGFAQEPGAAPEGSAPPPGQGPGGHHGMPNPDEQLAQMTKRYKLSADQQSQIKPVLESQYQQMQSLRGDSSLSRQDKMAKAQTLHADTRTKIEAVLNDQQKQQYEQDQQRMQERMQQRMQQGGGPGGGAPPPQQ